MNRSRLACALAVALSACGLGGKAATGSSPPKAEAPPAAQTTPFGPAPPTPTGFSVPVVPPTPESWPSPGAYGSPPPLTTAVPTPVQPITIPPGTQNVLLLGSDRRTGTGFRTDTIILASLMPRTHSVTLVSIPRDLYVYLPGYTMQRINAAWVYGETIGYPGGGPRLLFDTIRYNLGLSVDHYVLVEMTGFEEAIDSLGGVDVRVACSYTDWHLKARNLPPSSVASWALYTVPTGVIHMDGYEALWYARSRQRSSDFERSKRQQEVLRALYHRALTLDAFVRLPAFYADLKDLVETDVGLAEAGRLAVGAAGLDGSRLHGRFIGRGQVTGWTIPGSGAQVLLPKPEAVRALLDEAFSLPDDEPVEPVLQVEVVDAAGRPDWADLAAERLEYAGLATVIGPTSARREPLTSLVDFGRGSDDDRRRLLRALGLDEGSVVHLQDPESPAPFRLLVGENYNPCFDPVQITSS